MVVTLEHVQKPEFDRVMRKGWEESLRICGEPIPVADGGVLTFYCDVHDPARSEAAAGMVEFPDGLVWWLGRLPRSRPSANHLSQLEDLTRIASAGGPTTVLVRRLHRGA